MSIQKIKKQLQKNQILVAAGKIDNGFQLTTAEERKFISENNEILDPQTRYNKTK